MEGGLDGDRSSGADILAKLIKHTEFSKNKI